MLLQLRTVVVHPRSVKLRPVVDKVAQRQVCFWVRNTVFAYYNYSNNVLNQYSFTGI